MALVGGGVEAEMASSVIVAVHQCRKYGKIYT